jgi:hypothetical protein
MPSKEQARKLLLSALDQVQESNNRLTNAIIQNIDTAKTLLKLAGELGLVSASEVLDGIITADNVAGKLENHITKGGNSPWTGG